MSDFRTVTTRFNIADFGPQDVHLEDIATGLSKANRYNGQYVGDHEVSVAQHSVLISHMIDTECKWMFPDNPIRRLEFSLIGLLHDSSEAYLGDCPKPFKNLLPDFEAIENRFQSACYVALFGRDIQPDEHEFLKSFDRRMLDMECRELGRPTCYDLCDEDRLDDIFPHHWWSIREARRNFTIRYNLIYGEITSLKAEQAA